MNMSELIINTLNRLSVDAIQRTTTPNALKLWIEDGEITGFMGESGKLHKKIPTQTANPSGD